jgi:hypothetical protein
MRRFSRQLKVSVVLGTLAAVVGLVIPLFEPNGDPQDAIKLAQAKIDRLMSDVGKASPSDSDWIMITPSWYDVEDAVRHLHRSNRQIAEAKAMLRVPEACSASAKHILPCTSNAWDNRVQNASKPWHIEERQEQIKRALYTSVAAFAGAFVVCIIGLVSVTHLWYFLLERLTELASAFRGKQ